MRPPPSTTATKKVRIVRTGERLKSQNDGYYLTAVRARQSPRRLQPTETGRLPPHREFLRELRDDAAAQDVRHRQDVFFDRVVVLHARDIIALELMCRFGHRLIEM